MELKSDLYQAVRLGDVFVLAPIMIYAGVKGKNLPTVVRLFLITSGIGTAVFNGRNYLKIQCEKHTIQN